VKTGLPDAPVCTVPAGMVAGSDVMETVGAAGAAVIVNGALLILVGVPRGEVTT